MYPRDSSSVLPTIQDCILKYKASIALSIAGLIEDEKSFDVINPHSFTNKKRQNEKFENDRKFFEMLDFELFKAIELLIIILMEEKSSREDEERYEREIHAKKDRTHIVELKMESGISPEKEKISELLAQLIHEYEVMMKVITTLIENIIININNIKENIKKTHDYFVDKFLKSLFELYPLHNGEIKIGIDDKHVRLNQDLLLEIFSSIVEEHFKVGNQSTFEEAIKNQFIQIIMQQDDTISIMQADSIANKISNHIMHHHDETFEQARKIVVLQNETLKLETKNLGALQKIKAVVEDKINKSRLMAAFSLPVAHDVVEESKNAQIKICQFVKKNKQVHNEVNRMITSTTALQIKNLSVKKAEPTKENTVTRKNSM